MATIYGDFDVSDFWEDSDYATESYTEEPPTAESIASIEAELGVKLPAAYVELMRTRNGGLPSRTCFPCDEPTSWAQDHVAITGIMGIGRTKSYALCGDLGSPFMQQEWGYPDIGICICDCPSAGHDMIMLDYRKSGPQGEPEVVHVDQECDFDITFLAKDFETFVRGLVSEEELDTSEEDLQFELRAIESGQLSTLLAELIAASGKPDLERGLRRACRELTEDKGYFALHADERSYLLYDLQFDLFLGPNDIASEAAYLEAYPAMLALGDGGLSTGGYAPAFVEEWLAKRIADGHIVASASSLTWEPSYKAALDERIAKLCA